MKPVLVPKVTTPAIFKLILLIGYDYLKIVELEMKERLVV